MKPCPACKGEGVVETQVRNRYSSFAYDDVMIVCPHCDGEQVVNKYHFDEIEAELEEEWEDIDSEL